jgi:hypothetical protein
MIAAGVRKFACGISAGSAKTLRAQPDGKVLVTDGPYRDQGAHGRILILECADIDEALAWGRRVPSPAMWLARCASFFFPDPKGATE